MASRYWTGFSPNLNQAIIASGYGSGDSYITYDTNADSLVQLAASCRE